MCCNTMRDLESPYISCRKMLNVVIYYLMQKIHNLRVRPFLQHASRKRKVNSSILLLCRWNWMYG
jgi:hypothetical protein